jgi:shikimate kinase
MAFMWVRVLTRKAPRAVQAAPVGPQVSSQRQSNPQSKISFIELPKIPGRHDAITRDFFASDGWQKFNKEGQTKKLSVVEEVSVVSAGGSEEVARRVAEKLKLEAIVLSENPRAFVNNTLLSVGDKLSVSDGANTRQCEVVGIEQDSVYVTCEGAKITLKLTEVIEVGDQVLD